MSLREFLREEREEKKKRRQIQKEQKKGKKTKEDKKRILFGWLTFAIIAFGFIFCYCRGGSESYDWGKIMGLTDEMIVELEKKIDDSDILSRGKIEEIDWLQCNTILNNAGINYDNLSDNMTTKNFVLSDRQVGALSKKLISEMNNSVKINICDLEIYSIGTNIYEKTIVTIDLSQIISGSKLPTVYLTTLSRIEVLSNSLICLSTEMTINDIEKEVNDKIIEVFNKATYNQFSQLTNESINSSLTLFAESIGVEMLVSHGQIEFRV